MDRRRLLLVVAAVIAALGVALVFVYARGAESRAAEKYDTVEVLVVAEGKSILPGESINSALEAGKVVKAPVPRNQLIEGAGDSTEGLRDKVALTTLYAGEQVIPSKFGGVGESINTATLPLPSGRIGKFETFDIPVGSFVLPGSEVAVFLTTGQQSCLLVDRITVIAVGASTSAPAEDAVAPEASPPLALAVTQQQFELLEGAKNQGALSVGLLNSESNVKTGPCASRGRGGAAR